jgi:Tfp pilus assembly protein PilO
MLKVLEELAFDMKKLAAVGLVFAVVLYVDVAFVLKWQASATAETRKKIVSVKKDIDNVDSDLALMNRSQGAAKKVNLFTENEIPQLLESVSGLARDNSIRLLQITPVKSRDAKAPAAQQYVLLTLKLDMIAGYHELGLFLNQLESGSHPVFADDFRIAPGDDYQHQRISLSLKTYVKK